MSILDKLASMVRPYEEEDEFYDGSDDSERPKTKVKPQIQQPQPKPEAVKAASDFEKSFGSQVPSDDEIAIPDKAPEDEFSLDPEPSGTGLLGALGLGKLARPGREKNREQQMGMGTGMGYESKIVLFSPASFTEAGALAGYLSEGRPIFMSLDSEKVSDENARRLLDFMTGIAFAMNAKITQVSARAYSITPSNIDIVNAQGSSLL